MCDLIFIITRQSSSYSAMSRSYFFYWDESFIVCNWHYEQCQGEGEHFSSPLKYTNENFMSVHSCVIDTMNNDREKGNNSHRQHKYFFMSSFVKDTSLQHLDLEICRERLSCVEIEGRGGGGCFCCLL
jgi:hypothetical protein